jgi:hypothetical protein
MACHNILPRCQIKTTARTDFIGKYGLPFSEKMKKSFGSLLMTNRTFGKECWRDPLFNLRHPSSKSGKFIWQSGNHYSTKHKTLSQRRCGPVLVQAEYAPVHHAIHPGDYGDCHYAPGAQSGFGSYCKSQHSTGRFTTIILAGIGTETSCSPE